MCRYSCLVMVLLAVAPLGGCEYEPSHEATMDYIRQVKARASREIDPLPPIPSIPLQVERKIEGNPFLPRDPRANP